MTIIEKLEALHRSELPFTITNGKLFGFGARYNFKSGGQGAVSSDKFESCIERLWEAYEKEFPKAPCFLEEKPN